jgi:hypothetical protein
MKGGTGDVSAVEEGAKACIDYRWRAFVLRAPHLVRKFGGMQHLGITPRLGGFFLRCDDLIRSESWDKKKSGENAKCEERGAHTNREREEHEMWPPRTIVKRNPGSGDAISANTARSRT